MINDIFRYFQDFWLHSSSYCGVWVFDEKWIKIDQYNAYKYRDAILENKIKHNNYWSFLYRKHLLDWYVEECTNSIEP